MGRIRFSRTSKMDKRLEMSSGGAETDSDFRHDQGAVDPHVHKIRIAPN